MFLLFLSHSFPFSPIIPLFFNVFPAANTA
jgi:hypothetical protein